MRSRSPRSIGLALLGMASMLIMLLAACSGSSSNNDQAPDGKQVISVSLIPGANDIRRLDPAKVVEPATFGVLNLIFPGLVTYDNNYKIVPWAAWALPVVSNGGLIYTFKIRSDLKWSDGTPIDANTYAYSWNRSLDHCTKSSVASYLYPIKGAAAFNAEACSDPKAMNPASTDTLIGKSIVAQDPQTLVVTLEKPDAYFLPTVAGVDVTLAQPRQLIEKYGLNQWTQHVLDHGDFGGNLFNLSLWDHKGNVQVTRNEDFWGTKPKLRQINFKVYQDSTLAYAAYANKQVDVGVDGAPPSERSSPTSIYKYLKGDSDFHQAPSLITSYLALNWARPPFDDLEARQAFALAIDRDALNDLVLDSTIPTYHLVPQGEPGYDTSLTNINGRSGMSANKADVELARQLITDYAKRKCSGNIAKCPPVTYYPGEVAYGSTLWYSYALLQMWKTAMPGYPIQVYESITQVFNWSFPPQIFAYGWSADYPDPQDWLSLQLLPGSLWNIENVRDPAADDLMARADLEQNPQLRYQEYNQAEQILVDDVAYIVVDQQILVWLFDSHKIAGFRLNSSGYTTLPDWQNNIYVRR